MVDVLIQFLPLGVLLLLGALLGRWQFLSIEVVEGLKRIVAFLALPSLLFLAFSQVQVEGRLAYLALLVFASCGLLGLVGVLAARLLSLPRPATVFLFQGFEAGMLGYALFSALYGPKALPAFAAADLGQVVYVFTVLMFQLRRDQVLFVEPNSALNSYSTGFRSSLSRYVSLFLNMIRSPVILAILAGLFSSSLVPGARGLPWGEGGFLHPTFQTLGALTTPLVCLVVGFGLKDLSWQNIQSGVKLVVSRLLSVLAIAWLLVRFFIPLLNYEKIQGLALLTLFVLPPPFIIPVFRNRAEDSVYISSVLSLYTLVSILLAFGLALLWG